METVLDGEEIEDALHAVPAHPSRKKGPLVRAARAVLLILAFPACSDAPPAPPSAEATPGGPGVDRHLAVEVREIYRIGGFDAPAWVDLTRIAAMVFDTDGNLMVLDGMRRDVLVVDSVGDFVRRLGGPGEGPGEFQAPTGMAVLDDGDLTVFDAGAFRITRFSPQGDLRLTRPVDVGVAGFPLGPTLRPLGGEVIAEVLGPASKADPYARRVVALGAGADSGHRLLLDAWGPEPPDESGTRFRGKRVETPGWNEAAFPPPLSFAPFPDGRVAIVDSLDYRVRLIDGVTGRVERTLRRPLRPEPVTDEIRDAEVARRITTTRPTRRLGRAGSADPHVTSLDAGERAALLAAMIDDLDFPDSIPVLRRLDVDPEGRIWIERSSALRPSGPIDLFSPNGRYAGTIPPDELAFPDAFGPGGLAAWLSTDDLDVPVIRVGRVTLGR